MPKRAEQEPAAPPKLLRGVKDVLPGEQRYWHAVMHTVADLARRFHFERIDLPVIEEESLFVRSVGDATDIVEKEMFTFATSGGERVVLRPEMTASFARAYIEHGFLSLPQPVKLWSTGPIFRHNRPQSGRGRQFWQFDFETMGEAHPVVDAQLISIALRCCRELGLSVDLEINSIGHPDCRAHYLKILVDYYRTRKANLCEDCKRRLQKNPLRLLDCKEPGCQAMAAEAPQIVDHLCDDCRKHFTSVLEYLDELDLHYQLNPRLVRGLDYYIRTTFEIFPVAEPGVGTEHRLAIAGGGRWDSLIESLGGRPTPACGFAFGIDRLVSALKSQQTAVPELPNPSVFLAQLGERSRVQAFKLYRDLVEEGIAVAESFAKEGIKPQLEVANRIGATIALILGQKEIIDGTIIFRDMENGVQEIVAQSKTVAELKKRLGLNGKP